MRVSDISSGGTPSVIAVVPEEPSPMRAQTKVEASAVEGPPQGGPSGAEQKWRGELARLTGLVRDMKEQQTISHRDMLRLHRQQQKELHAAIERVVSSAPGGPGPPSQHPAVLAGESAEKSAVRVLKKVNYDDGGSASEVSRPSAAEVSHPCAVQELARASGIDDCQIATVPEEADAAVEIQSLQLSQKSLSPQKRSLQALAANFCKHAKQFFELYRSNVLSTSRKSAHKRARGKLTNLQLFVSSIYFQIFVSVTIQVSSICIGFEVDSQLKDAYQGQVHEDEWENVEICFTAFFTLELILRVAAERWAFIFGENWSWNLFDFVLVSEAIFDMILTHSTAPDFTFTRILRLVRITRVLRILRAMRSCQTLRVMVVSILSSMASLLWVFVLILFVIYFFAVLFASGIAERFSISEGDHQVSSAPDSVEENYGSIMSVMVSLFMCISGGDDWSVMVSPLYEVHTLYVALFVVYIFFMAFGILNVVVGQFVDNAARASQKDKDAVVQNELRQDREYSSKMQRIFKDADTDGDAQLSWPEFQEYLSNGQTAAYFSAAGLDASIARTLFVLLDVDDTGKVGIDEFVDGCMRLKGGARSLDVNMLLYETEKICHKLTGFIQDTAAFMQDTTGTLHRLTSDTAPVAWRKNGPDSTRSSDPDAEGLTPPVEGLSETANRLQSFRGRSVGPCARLLGSQLVEGAD
jgi:voltage-gated sodium channel